MVESAAFMAQNLILIFYCFMSTYTKVTNLMVESVACMLQNLILELIQSVFGINDCKSAECMTQNSNGVMDGCQTMDRLSNPDLLHSQMGYILFILQHCMAYQVI
jgi:hypothetical protein